MDDLVPIDLEQSVGSLAASGKGRVVLWQDAQTLGFLSRGRAGRRDFHVDPSDEINLQIRGVQHLHYLTPDGAEKVAEIHPGQMLVMPAGVPHSPRVSDDAFFVVVEGARKPREEDRFQWKCDESGAIIHEVSAVVGDYSADAVGQVLASFYADEQLRTCGKCGWIVPVPPGSTAR
jgi:3-hydroxyanthranilate 3,4-dioxygenase